MERHKSSPSALCPEVNSWKIHQIKDLYFPDTYSGIFNEEIDPESRTTFFF